MTRNQYDVLITDANQRVALEVARCLGSRGVRILLVEQEKHPTPLSFGSRHALHTRLVASYRCETFRELCRQSRWVMPISTNTHLDLYEIDRDSVLERCLLPDEETFRNVNNKLWLTRKAEELGLPVPETSLVKAVDSVQSVLGNREYPLVLKLSDDEDLYLSPSERYEIVEDEGSARQALRSLRSYGKPIIVQEYIPGRGVGYSGVYDRSSRLVGGIAHERLREWPPEGGPSTYCRALNGTGLSEMARRLLESIGWVGPAMVEFRQDCRDGSYKILEVNPRYWGSLPLSRVAGMNLPFAHYCLLRGTRPPEEVLRFNPGVTVRFLFSDMMSWSSSDAGEGGSKLNFIHYLRDCLFSNGRFGIWDAADPWPFFRYAFQRINRWATGRGESG